MTTLIDTLLEPVPTYPVFEPNQLLSFRDLNQIREYLDQQTRLSRVCLSGAGIVCGLVPRWEGESLVVSAGCGVTTEGFLVALEGTTLRHYRADSIPLDAFFHDGKPLDQTVDVFELFEEPEKDRKELSGDFVDGKVVALLLECVDEKNEACLDDCDDKGVERELKVRKFLIEPGKADEIAKRNFNPPDNDGRRRYPGWSLENLLVGRFNLKNLYLERFGFQVIEEEARTSLDDIKSYQEFLRRYREILKLAGARILDALQGAHWALSPLFAGDAPTPLFALTTQPMAGRFTENPTLETTPIQYVYDLYSDLILAYNEFRDVAFDLMSVCRAETGWFPKHLFLGEVLGAAGALPVRPSLHRTPYAQPPVYNGNSVRVDLAWKLFERLGLLIGAFEVPKSEGPSDIRITPSRWGTVPLSSRALPFYYEPENEDLRRVWNPDAGRRGRGEEIHSYFRAKSSPYDTPLLFDFEGSDFFRIEGHVGLTKREAFGRIDVLRKQHNLAFDLVVLKLGEKPNRVDFQHDCEFQLLEVHYSKVRTDLLCALDAFYNGDYPTEVQDLLRELPESLGTFVFQSFKSAFDRVLAAQEHPHRTCLLGYDAQAFETLFELHRARKNEVLNQTLFHEFAAKHPGMEHKAGVPRGGTFVLVYNETPLDDEERERLRNRFENLRDGILGDRFEGFVNQTIVGDFCLPYLCCADCPPTAYVVERPRPRLGLDPLSFCADDEQEYSFKVDPPGGVITGPGTRQDESGYFFVPSNAGVDEGPVEVGYSFDGAEAELTLRIMRVPTFEEIPEVICDDAEVPLIPSEGTSNEGTFQTEIGGSVSGAGIRRRESDGQLVFDPNQEGVPVGVPIGVIYEVKDADSGLVCGSRQETLVVEKPQASFTIEYVGPSGEASSRTRISNILPEQRDDRPLKYRYVWRLGNGRGTFHRREDSADFDFDVPAVGGILTIFLLVEDGPCESEPSVEQTVFLGAIVDASAGEGLQSRIDRRASRLSELGEGLGQTKTFQLAEAVVGASPGRSTKKLVDDFSSFVATLTRGYRQLDNDERKQAFRALADLAANSVLDRVGSEPPGAATQKKVAEHLAILADVDVDLDALRDEWLGGDFAEALADEGRAAVKALF